MYEVLREMVHSWIPKKILLREKIMPIEGRVYGQHLKDRANKDVAVVRRFL